jgi:hypothetical protein
MLRVSGAITDEGFSGSRVRDTENKNRFTRDGADFLSSAIRTASQPVKSNTTSNRAAISQTSGNIAKALGENTEAVQKILGEQDNTRDEFVKLTKMLSASQQKTGEASVTAIKQLIKQIEKIKLSAGDRAGELSSNLNLSGTEDVLKKQLEPLGFLGTAFKKFTNVDLREGKMSDAFSKSALLGNGPSADAIVNTLAAEVVQGEQGQNLDNAAAALTDPNYVVPSMTPNEENAQGVVPSMTPNEENAQGNEVFDSSGIDRESFDSQQVELEEKQVVLLTDILKELEKNTQTTESKGGIVDTALSVAGGTGLAVTGKKLFDRVRGRTPAPSPNVTTPTIDNKPRGTDPNLTKKPSLSSRFGRVARFGGRLLSRAALPLAAGMSLYDGFKGFNADPNAGAAERFGNAGSSVLNGLTFGLLGRNSDEIAAESAAGRETTTTAPLSSIEGQNMARDMGAFEETVQPTVRRRNRGPRDTLNRQSTEPDFLPGPGTNALEVGSGIYSADAQGVSPNVMPTGDAVGNMSDAYEEKVGNVINNINNITNNNMGGGGGSQSSPVLVNPSTIRNPNNSFIDFQYRQFTRI